jgi:hypothetical protein
MRQIFMTKEKKIMINGRGDPSAHLISFIPVPCTLMIRSGDPRQKRKGIAYTPSGV